MKIYNSRVHLAVTFLLVVAPFLFLLFVAQTEQIDTANLFSDVFVSIVRLAAAYFIAAGLALVLSLIFYKGALSHLALPLFDILQSFPEFAILPLAIIYWGASNFTVVFFLVLTIIWPILFSIVSSLKLARNDIEEAIEVYHLSGIEYIKKYLWPLSTPGLITGSIIGLGEGWGALVATEIILRLQGGLGDFFLRNSQNSMLTVLGVLSLLLIVFSINKLIWTPLLDASHNLMEE